jgi:predicted ribonuclease toxin of YeeF-YezG toxin-antitoxin module
MSNNNLNEATVTSSSSGKYQAPLSPGIREFDKQEMQPFYIPTSKYDDAELAYDGYDGKMSTPKNKIKKMETNARKISNYIKKHPNVSDDDGNNLNSSNGPIKNENMRDVIKNVLREDLGVWFGTKKKPKGSKQPGGPWVNICRKKEGGGHPPCGRPEASSKGYPKCRAAGVASKMTDSQKKSACQQKRTAEKSEPKTGTGNKPTMVSYKPKNKQNEDTKKTVRLTESDLVRLVKKIINEQIG